MTLHARPIGQILLSKGMLTEARLEEALAWQKNSGGKLGEVCLALGFVTEDDLLDVLEVQLGLPRVRLDAYLIEPEAVALIPQAVARRHGLIPIFRIDRTLTVAMADPLNVYAIDEVQQITGLDVDTAIASRREIDDALHRHYGTASTLQQMVAEIDSTSAAEAKPVAAEATAEDGPVIRLVNALLSQAIGDGGSDLHLEPTPSGVRVRVRVDGALHEVSRLPRAMHAPVVSRIKVMGHLDIAERRVPQDGRLQVQAGARMVDMRVSTFPTHLGEKVVVRVLDPSRVPMGLDQLGMEPDTQEALEEAIARPTGIVLLTGPTGSGKTTTLYAALRRVATIEKNVMTVEDPIEYFLDTVNQTQVNPRAGLTFATGLRSILRQDPDVIMVGEVRDQETAEMAIRAAMTGHLILSTLHTNDAASALSRLVDMGVEPFLAASAVTGILGQRLVRVVCRACAEPCAPAPETLARLGPDVRIATEGLRRGRGCPRCRETGYQGRMGIFELLRMDPDLEDLVCAKARASAIRARAVAGGMRTLRQDGLLRAERGVTTLEEVLRVT